PKMKLSRRWLVSFGASAATLPIFSSIAGAQAYPSRPITIIVPVPPGGVGDPIARILADHLSVTLGEPVVVENVTGAGGSIGVGRAARAAPDGYTLSIGNWLSHVGASAVYPVQYDVLSDFEAVSLLTNSPILITARKDFPANDLNELIAWLKANPDKATAATVGAGRASHVSSVYFQRVTGTRFRALSRRRPRHPGRGRRPCRPHVQRGGGRAFLRAQPAGQALCGAGQEPLVRGARHPDQRRTRRARDQYFILARLMGAQGHAEGHCGQAQCGGGRRARRPDRAQAAHRYRPGD